MLPRQKLSYVSGDAASQEGLCGFRLKILVLEASWQVDSMFTADVVIVDPPRKHLV